jgi:hydroxyacylglutathione hydrolase
VTELTVTRLPAFDDNYLWMIHGTGSRQRHVAVVDPGDADVIQAALAAHRCSLDAILVTHHHRDHTGGVARLAEIHGCPVYGPARESIPAITHPLKGGDGVSLPSLGLEFRVIDVPGHTGGHIAYVGHGALFCGDTLFSGGCGRLFEGTAEQMLASLDQLAALDPNTHVYCAHEYTTSNLAFARAVEPSNTELADYSEHVRLLRQTDQPTVPTLMSREMKINPFLRSRLPSVYERVWSHAGVSGVSEAETFRLLREWKNHFRG